MKTCRFAIITLLVFGSSLGSASDEEGEMLLADLQGLQLSLEGADYYYWLTPINGRVVLNKQCVPAEQDCDHNVLVVWDEHGEKIFERVPRHDITDMAGGKVFDTALLGTNRLFLSTVTQAEGYPWILAEYDLDKEKIVHRFPTAPARCHGLYGDDEGTIWCLGSDPQKRKDGQDYDLVYLFDDSGTLQNSSLPRSTFPDTHKTACCRRDYFLGSDDNVALWLSGANELIRFELDGSVRDRLSLPTLEGQKRERLAMAPDGGVFAMLITAPDAEDADDPDTWTQGLYRLAPDGGSWIPLQDPLVQLPMRIELKGADESGLILLDRESLRLLWYPYDQFVANN